MSEAIIHPNDDGSITLLIPSGELSLEQTALKDVPANTPFRYINIETDLPEQGVPNFFSAWESDFSSPDGYGMGAESWFASQQKNTNS